MVSEGRRDGWGLIQTDRQTGSFTAEGNAEQTLTLKTPLPVLYRHSIAVIPPPPWGDFIEH
jgi:hypothetical protein